MKIMAPAGSLESMNAAIRAGADEVYMGISGFGARRFARNFSVQEYCDAVGEAHRFGTAVNVTLNTILAQEEFEELHESLEMLYAAGTDAVIIQDLGFADFLKTHFPAWPRHASTQLSIAGPEEARWAEEQGFSRLVLARELSLEEIQDVRDAVSAELEIFASGALCIACSGKCFLSSFIGGRSGNRGMCTQPCRQKYRWMGTGKSFSVNRSGGKPGFNPKGSGGLEQAEGFLFSSCDQWQEFPEILRLFAMGVEVIKLEGRMKSPEYVFTAVRYYREMIDTLKAASPKKIEQALKMAESAKRNLEPHPEIEKLFNRGYSKGYFYAHDPDFINADFSASWGVKAGEIRKGAIQLKQPLRHGDGVVFLDRNLQKIDGLNVSKIILEKSGEAVSEAPRGAFVSLGVPVPKQAVFLFKTFDFELNRQLGTEMKLQRRRNPIRARLCAKVGEPLELTLSAEILGRNFSASACSSEVLEESKKFPCTRESLLTGLDRFGETPFFLDEPRTRIEFAPTVFVPKSVLNQVRQEAASALEREIVEGLRRNPISIQREALLGWTPKEEEAESVPSPIFTAAVSTLEQARVCWEMGIQKIYRLEPPVHFGKEVRSADDFPFEALAGSLFDAVEYSQCGKNFAIDWMFHAANPGTLRFLRREFPLGETIFLSPELSEETVRKLAGEGLRDANLPRLGLVIYGFLYGMFTRKTLFDFPVVHLQNQDGRPICVTRNADSENPLERTGSRVYYGNRMDISLLLAQNPVPGLAELRLDFTLETPEEVRQILENVLSRGWNQAKPFSYGYEKGIF